MFILKFIFCAALAIVSGCTSYSEMSVNNFDPNKIKSLKVQQEPISIRGKKNYKLNGVKYSVRKKRNHFHQTGLASWYVGNKKDSVTAINETYDIYGLTAAHKTLPLPSYALITNLENHKRILVRINDRGPYIDGRVIDLSYAAAYKLGMHKSGVARVQIDTIDHY